jgi:biopolymer transport protein ExbD
MAEIQESSGGGKKKGGVRKGKKLSTRIDLTPMVDLGFLLITFFIFTTTMSKPKTMEVYMPVDKKDLKEDETTKVKDYTAMTILLSREHRVYYYTGLANDPMHPPDVKVTYFQNRNGIRDAIMELKKKVDIEKVNGMPGHSPDDKAVVLIKPDSNSTYKDMVDVLDEMAINDIRIYAMVDITAQDQEFIRLTEAANGVAQ